MRTRWSTGHRTAVGALIAVTGAVCCCAGIGIFGGKPSAPPYQSPQASTSSLPSSSPEPEPAVSELDLPDTSVYYANCDQVRRAGQAPLYLGEPGYRKGLDRDGDGKACDS